MKAGYLVKSYYTTENTEDTEEEKRRGEERRGEERRGAAFSSELFWSLFLSPCSPCSPWLDFCARLDHMSKLGLGRSGEAIASGFKLNSTLVDVH
jgi:hypothetical protein